VTAGFYSKDLIIWQAFAAVGGGIWPWTAALAGALLTSLYTFRMVFLTFEGPLRTAPRHLPGWEMKVPMVVLAAFSMGAGFLEIPDIMGPGVHFFSDFIRNALPTTALAISREGYEISFEWISAAAALLGVLASYIWVMRAPAAMGALVRSGAGRQLHRFWFSGWGFDWLYDWILVRPYAFLARVNRQDVIDDFFTGLSEAAGLGHRGLSATQNGRMRTYAAGLAAGAAVVLAMVVWL
jgi:NADH-quinone oxidoreductase subunit L